MDDNGNSTIQEVPINYIKSRIEMISPLSNDTLDFNVNNNFICKIISHENDIIRPAINDVTQNRVHFCIIEPPFQLALRNHMGWNFYGTRVD